MNAEAIYANALNHIPKLGPASLRKLRAKFGSYKTAWHAHASALKSFEPEKEYILLSECGIGLVLEDEKSYPLLLRTIPCPPALLYVKGTLTEHTAPALAVVGTRSPTAYGREACKKLVEPLAANGIPIISGLAVGIDTEAHKATLDAGGYTVAVLGSGILKESLYPSVNKHLSDDIAIKKGAVISEYPPTFKATSWTFPQRNRIIAGLATAVLVIEAKEKSGARITARLATEYGRDVFALPGPIFSAHSATPHNLIKEGAALVTSAEDIFYALGITPPSVVPTYSHRVSPEEQAVLAFLEEPASANAIARAGHASISAVQRTLALLEIRDMVRNIGNGQYRKI